MQRPELQNNLVSINKIASDRTSLSIIGMVTSKRATKNKNLILTVEDLTGSIQILIRNDKTELLTIGEELRLDDIIGIKASGSRDMLFAHDIFFPDSILHEKHQFNEDVRIAFLSDFHAGSDRHLKRECAEIFELVK
jgi:DNA polymerase II small subunit/DNA polymerase delta subunit B